MLVGLDWGRGHRARGGLVSGRRAFAIKVLGASSEKADANLYVDGDKVAEVIIRRETGAPINLIELLGERFELVAVMR
jgi:hypothetical protein